jgi:ferric-dicitrate binding protein FerR (iron transport regulator)
MKSILDRAIQAMRNNSADTEEIRRAADRTLARLQSEHNKVIAHPALSERISSCADFRTLIPAYLSSALTPSRALLIEDHMRECVECRHALQEARFPRQAQTDRLTSTRSGIGRYAWVAAAATVLLIVGFSQINTVRDLLWPIEVSAVVRQIEGQLFRISADTVTPIAAGQRIERDAVVRTGKSSGAILVLPDGSKVEMGERSELSLDRAGDGLEVELARGNVIVTAAKQREGHLYVVTTDATVSVVGTVFSVHTGTKGSRVSVLEGEVHVEHGETSKALFPGQQVSTNAISGTVPLEQEIAWSQEAEVHRELLRELIALNRDLGSRIAQEGLRYSSPLIDLAPPETLVLVAIPNLTESFAQAYDGFRQRVIENPTLRPWWESETAGSEGMTLDELINRVRRVGSYLGPEILIVLPHSHDRQSPNGAVIIAEVPQPDGLNSALAELNLRGLTVRVSDGLFVASTSAALADMVVAQKRSGAANPFSQTALYGRVAGAYREGVGWLLAADFESIAEGDQVSGLADAKQLLIEQKTGYGQTAFHATLGFDQTRRGLVSWLSEPAAMGSLEFVSPNAYGAAGVLTKDPSYIVEDIFTFLLSEHGGIEKINELQEKHRIDIRQDLAAPLGGEFLFAIDGPLLPTPAWKVVAEVYDAARLQNTIQWMISEFNREVTTGDGLPALNLRSEMEDGRTFYTISTSRVPVELHYTFWSGYLIAAPKRALLTEAIQYKDTGSSLGRSPSFQAAIPADGHDYFSGFFYQNLEAVTDLVPETIAPGNILPTLICMYGEPNQIVMSSKGVLGMNLASLTGMAASLGK